MSGADERKVSSLRELSPAIEPARDLWPQIEARINAERSAAAPGRRSVPYCSLPICATSPPYPKRPSPRR